MNDKYISPEEIARRRKQSAEDKARETGRKLGTSSAASPAYFSPVLGKSDSDMLSDLRAMFASQDALYDAVQTKSVDPDDPDNW